MHQAPLKLEIDSSNFKDPPGTKALIPEDGNDLCKWSVLL